MVEDLKCFADLWIAGWGASTCNSLEWGRVWDLVNKYDGPQQPIGASANFAAIALELAARLEDE